MKTKIQMGIIIGGRSVEHDISLISGLQTKFATSPSKYDTTIFYLTKDNHLYIKKNFSGIDDLKEETFPPQDEVVLSNINQQVYYRYITKPKRVYPIDVFLPVVHGYGVEDGTICGYLDMYNAIYPTSYLIPSAIIQDKWTTKVLLKEKGYPVLHGFLLKENETIDMDEIEFPVIVKPVYLGSSIGISVAKTKEQFKEALKEAFRYTGKVVVEKALTQFLEYNCALIKDHDEIIASCIEEVKHEEDILSFVEKYESDLSKLSDATNRIIPALIDQELEERIKILSKDIYQYLDLDGVVRIDFLYETDTSTLYVNEINNIPGSLAFYLFEPAGIPFSKLIDILVNNAMIRFNNKQKKETSFTSNVFEKKSFKLMNK